MATVEMSIWLSELELEFIKNMLQEKRHFQRASKRGWHNDETVTYAKKFSLVGLSEQLNKADVVEQAFPVSTDEVKCLIQALESKFDDITFSNKALPDATLTLIFISRLLSDLRR
jgi:hypothetical protein